MGTSGVKISVFSGDMKEYWSDSEAYPLLSPSDGYAEQDPESWWQAVCRGLRSLLQNGKFDARRIAGVGFSGQMHGLVLLDKNKEVICPAIIHCDSRAKDYKNAFTKNELLSYGVLNPIFSGFQMTSFLWLKDNRPDVFGRIAHVLSPKDYIRYRITDTLGTEWTDASATLLFDVVHGCWSKEVLSRLQLDGSVLSDIHAPYEICGNVTRQAALETGLYAGTKVSYGGADQAMQALGNGVINPGDMTCTIGSGGQLLVCCDEPLANPKLNTHTFCNLRRNTWYLLGAMLTAGTAYNHMAALFFGNTKFSDIDREVERILKTDSALFFLPYLNGERSPHMDEQLRGVFYGMSLEHQRAHYMRAVMEGICFCMRDMYEVLSFLRVPHQRMIASGGYTYSELWMGMMASILKRPLYRVEKRGYQASIGAAMTAGVGCGIYASFEEAIANCVHFSDTVIQPEETQSRYYDQKYAMFRNVFQKCFGTGGGKAEDA